MPFRHSMYRLLAAHRLEQERQALHAVDEAAHAAVDEARAKRDLHLEHLGYPLRTASPSPEVEPTQGGALTSSANGGRPATSAEDAA